MTTPCCSPGNVGPVLRGKLVITLPAYSHFRRTHTPLVVSRYPSRLAWSRRGLLTRLAWARCSRGIRHARRGLVTVFSHALRGLVGLAVSLTPGVVSSRSSHTPCVGSLVSRYPSRPVWSRRGLLTRLAWARWSRGIRHARRGLVAVFSHALRGLVVLAVSVTPCVVSSRSSHTTCMASLFLSGWWSQRRFTGRER